MKFPLLLSFPIISLARQVTVTDADGATVCFVRQKIMKLKEVIEVFTDKKRTEKICDIKADRVIDFSATYHFTDCNGQNFGAISRKGMRSLWKAHYEIMDPDGADMIINEVNPLVKMIDGFVGEIPIIGMFSGLMFHPSYIVTNSSTGQEVVRIQKCSSFFESKFNIEKLGDFENDDEIRIMVATLMMVLLEKNRG